jgi:hypothetical protein
MNWINQCEELWGERWKSTLALTAGVTKRNVFRWFSGEYKIPPRVEQGIQKTWEIWVDEQN